MEIFMDFQRARTTEQIQNRKQEIIDAAISIYDSVGYDGLTFTAISEYTNFTRPNIYKYFKTKDEILLSMIIQEFDSYSNELIGSYHKEKKYTLLEISSIWTESTLNHTRFLDLFSLLFTLIENNVSVEALSEYKKTIIPMQTPLNNLISWLFPNADAESIYTFSGTQLSLAFSLYPMSKCSNVQSAAIALSGMNYKPIDFKKTYQSGLYKLMYCLQNNIDTV